ncbi:unnamed protein product [Cylicostephanus goldi]|uniref:Uncharacterized protein n=1 Tax=Cylicostephanus goldi TaxID=71465 RepID=A0A3P6SNX2_CYLGO|nr:unnamed protein product [Cylicostephanus goldi]
MVDTVVMADMEDIGEDILAMVDITDVRGAATVGMVDHMVTEDTVDTLDTDMVDMEHQMAHFWMS